MGRPNNWFIGILAAAILFFAAPFGAQREKLALRPSAAKNAIARKKRTGRASWYGRDFIGREMADGQTYEADAVFVANRTLPFGTVLRIENLDNHRVIMAKVEDRGPYIHGRSLDVSRAAAKRLGMIEKGVVPVSYEVIH